MRLLAAVLSLAAICAAQDLARGVIVDPVACQADPRQTYALYLPSAYTTQRVWPVLYCLDAGARGRVPVERFRAAAEKFGYVVAGSNNSRNGPAQPSLEAAAAMWKDTHERLVLQEGRAYGAGFSGGARVLSVLAAASGAFNGVILCGAGLSPALKAPEFRVPVFGTAGDGDFNYFELRQLDRALDSAGQPHRVVIFEGEHDWPPAEVAAQALEWFELAAMKAGTRPRDDQMIREMVERLAAAARARQAAGELAAALADYAAAADAKGLADVAQYEAQAAALARSPELKRAERRYSSEFAEYQRLLGDLVRFAMSDESDELARSIAALRSQSEKARTAADRRQAERVLNGAAVYSGSRSGDLLAAGDYAAAARWLELFTALRGGRPLAEYRLACAYAQIGERQRAFTAWRRAVRDGFGYLLFFASCRR